MLKIGVLGAGHLGKIHIKLLLELKESYEFVGFYDANPENAQKVSEEFSINSFETIESLIDAVDVVDIVTPTVTHFECAKKAIEKRKHVFIEKPLTETIEEGEELIRLSEEYNVKVQVGHVERFNPAFKAVKDHFENPLFIETHRLAQFNPRGCDVPVVLDLMIHDLDYILNVVPSPVKNISASGVAVVSDTSDITNARIEFENGCVANLTASRISVKNMRKSRFFQKDAYISVDFLSRESEIVKMKDLEGEPDPFEMVLDLGEGKKSKVIHFNKPQVEDSNAIKEELKTFSEAIIEDKAPIVTIQDGFKALKVAHEILEKVEKNRSVLAQNI